MTVEMKVVKTISVPHCLFCGHLEYLHLHYKKLFGFLWHVIDETNTSCVEYDCNCKEFNKTPQGKEDLLL